MPHEANAAVYYLYTENNSGHRMYADGIDGKRIRVSKASTEWWDNFNKPAQIVSFKSEQVDEQHDG